MKNFQKQALAIITLIMLITSAACNSLSPTDNSVGNHESAPTQADGELFDRSEVIDFSELSLASEEISDEISEEISEEFSETSSDESFFESLSEEVSAVIEPLTEQATNIILRVENGRDFEFEDRGGELGIDRAPSAFFVDTDETVWLFDSARKQNNVLVYKNGALTATIHVPDFATYSDIYMQGDATNIYVANESDNYSFDGKIWTINKLTHEVTSTVYYACDRSRLGWNKEHVRYFMTINGNVYLYVSDMTESKNPQEEKDVFYLVNDGSLTRCVDERFSITSSYGLQTNSPFASFSFFLPENMRGNYRTQTYGHYARFLKVDDNGLLVLSRLDDSKYYSTVGIYNYNTESRLLSFAYTLPTRDKYSYIAQEFTTSPNGKIYRMEARKGKDFSGIIISRIILGTRIQSAEELTKTADEYEKEIKFPQTYDDTNVSEELIPSTADTSNTLLTPEEVNALFPTGITRSQILIRANNMCNTD